MKVSYNTMAWDETGTIYRQRITMTEREFDAICDAIYCEITMGFPQKDKYSHECEAVLREYFEVPKISEFKPSPFAKPQTVAFLTLTQARYLRKYTELNKRLNADRYNTYILITR